MALGTLLLALGTLGVAMLTGRTARRTRELAQATVKLATSTEREVQAVVEQAEAARQQVEVSQEALLATYRPRLLNVPLGWTEVGPAAGARRTYVNVTDIEGMTDDHLDPVTDAHRISVPIRNVGTGLALIRRVQIRWHSPDAHHPEALGELGETGTFANAFPSVLPPSEQGLLQSTFSIGAQASILGYGPDLRRFSVDVDYTDMSGQLHETVRLDVSQEGDPPRWYVWTVHFYVTGESKPYASSVA